MQLADDVLQETFLTVSAKADSFERGSNFVAWACSVAHYKVLEESRRNRRSKGLLSPEVLDAICSTDIGDAWNDQAERLEALKDCLVKLAPHTKRAFELRYENAHTSSEIAKILGWTADSVNVILSRGRKSLRKCINANLSLGEHGY